MLAVDGIQALVDVVQPGQNRVDRSLLGGSVDRASKLSNLEVLVDQPSRHQGQAQAEKQG
ncbi:hypothetical protein D3C85_907850 [compost metagenome]